MPLLRRSRPLLPLKAGPDATASNHIRPRAGVNIRHSSTTAGHQSATAEHGRKLLTRHAIMACRRLPVHQKDSCHSLRNSTRTHHHHRLTSRLHTSRQRALSFSSAHRLPSKMLAIASPRQSSPTAPVGACHDRAESALSPRFSLFDLKAALLAFCPDSAAASSAEDTCSSGEEQTGFHSCVESAPATDASLVSGLRARRRTILRPLVIEAQARAAAYGVSNNLIAIGIATAQDVERVARECRDRSPPQPSFPQSAGGLSIPRSAGPPSLGPTDPKDTPPPSFVLSPMPELVTEPDMVCEPLSDFPLALELQAGPAGGHATPLWLVHPGAGFATPYLGLGALGRPVYGLSNAPLANGFRIRSVRHAARLYLDEVRRVQPTGPYLLGGWSFGGVCAQEMAAMLVSEWASLEPHDADDASRHVDVLMIDSFRPPAANKAMAATSEHSSGVEDASPSLPPPTPRTTAAAQQSVSSNVALRKLGGATLAHLCDQYRLATHLLRRHEPRRIAKAARPMMRVHLLKAAKLGPMPRGVSSEMRIAAVKRLCAKHNGWDDDQLAPGLVLPDGALDVQTLAASHDDMFSEMHLGGVTAWLRERLSLAEARH